MNLVAKDCGKHWGHKPGPCAKCALPDNRRGRQYQGTPWVAIFEPSEAMAEQDRIALRHKAGIK